MLPTEFQVNWPFGSGKEAKDRFLVWWVSNPNDFSHPYSSYQVSSQLTFWFRRRSKNTHGHRLGFQIGTILAIFDLQITPMLPTNFQASWPFGSGEEDKIRF